MISAGEWVPSDAVEWRCKSMPPHCLESKGFLESFLFGLAIDALGCNGTCLEARDGDLFAARFTDTKGLVFNAIQGFFDFFNEFVLPVTGCAA
jgi:hypothetical protein